MTELKKKKYIVLSSGEMFYRHEDVFDKKEDAKERVDELVDNMDTDEIYIIEVAQIFKIKQKPELIPVEDF